MANLVVAVVVVAASYVIGRMAARSPAAGDQLQDDLRITGTDYGTGIPWGLGAPRVAGLIWWASDIRPTSHDQEVGKGGGGSTVTSYTYDVDLLVGVNDGPIAAITRIWLNGDLAYTNLTSADDASRIASEDSKRWQGLAIYLGTETQLPDPTYEAAVGAGNAPAYRGRAYVVFQGLQLGSSPTVPNITIEYSTAVDPNPVFTRKVAVSATGVTFGSTAVPAILAMQPEIRVTTLGSTGVYRWAIDGTYIGTGSRSGASETNYPAFSNPVYPVGVAAGVAVTMNNSKLNYASGSGQICLKLGAADMMAPLPAGRYLGGVALCSDGVHAMIFTAPSGAYTGAAVIDAWHLVDCSGGAAVLVASGTLGSPQAIWAFGFGNSTTYHYACCMLEDDLRHVWTAYGAGDGQVVMYALNAHTGVLAESSRLVHGAGLLNYFYTPPSIWAQAGYCIAVSANTLCVFARSGVSIATLTVRSVVEAICARAGLSPAQIDASPLASITTPVHALATGQVGPMRGLLEQIDVAYRFEAVCSDKLYFRPRGGASAADIPLSVLAAGRDKAQAQPMQLTLSSDIESPPQVALKYKNVANDHQPGTEYSDRLISGQAAVDEVQLGLAMLPSEAKSAADAIVADRLASQTTGEIALPIEYAALEPSDVIQVQGTDGALARLRILRRADADGVLACELVADDAQAVVSAGVTSNAYASQSVVQALAATDLQVMDIPILRDADDAPGVYVAACPATAGSWPGCVVLSSADGDSYKRGAAIAESAVIGHATTALGAWAGGWVMDETNTVTVSLEAGELSSVTRDALLSDQKLNALLIGDEILRFAVATQTGANPNVYKLTRLLRGQKGTEWATDGHAVGDRIVLLRAQGLRRLALQTGDIGKTVYAEAVTSGDLPSSAVAHTFTFVNRGQVPLAPVDIRLTRTETDDLKISWKRRTRLATRFCGPSGIYVPLGESSESYAVQIMSGDAVVRTITCGEQKAIYTRIQARADHGAVPDTLTVQVRQISSTVGYGRSGSATLQVPASIAGNPASPGGPLPDPPTVPLRTAVPTHLVCETAAGVLAMREEAGAPVYYVSSGASMVPLGMASSAFMSKGNRNRVIEYAGTVWYFASLPSNAREIYAITVPADYSAAPTLQGSAVGWLVSAAHTAAPFIIGADAARVVAWNDADEVFVATTMPTFTYVGDAQPDASVGWSAPYSYFPVFSLLRAPLMLRTSAGWILAGSGYTPGLWVYRTTDVNAQANWINCATVSAQAGMDYEIYRQSEFYDAIAIGSRVYLSGKWLGLSFLAISSDSGVTWAKYSTGLRAYWHLMKLGSVVVAISADGKRCAINGGSGTAWAEHEMVGLGLPPYFDITKPRGEFFIDRSESYDSGGYLAYDKDVIMHTSDGITWNSVA